MEKITANMRRLTITSQESGARLREPEKTLLLSTNLPFYEVKMTPFAHGGISIKKFVMHVHILDKTLSHKFHPYSILST